MALLLGSNESMYIKKHLTLCPAHSELTHRKPSSPEALRATLSLSIILSLPFKAGYNLTPSPLGSLPSHSASVSFTLSFKLDLLFPHLKVQEKHVEGSTNCLCEIRFPLFPHQ